MRTIIKIVLAVYLFYTTAFGFPNEELSEENLELRNTFIQISLSELDLDIGKNDIVPGKSSLWSSGKKSKRLSRVKRYLLQGSRWKINPITYRISKYPSIGYLDKEKIDKEIEDAFRMWEDVTNLSFKKETDGKVNIDIKFVRGNHGDDEPFDGRGGMTAHAFYPNFGGAIHFDADEIWTSQSYVGINLFQVATHEIGHALGLEHTDSLERTVMSPYYINYDVNFKLEKDDIEGIQQLYGKKSHSICDSSNIDAGVTMVDGATYIFTGNLVYKLETFGEPIHPDFPKDISTVFKNLRGPLDAVFTRSNGVTYFFKGDEFWRWTNMSMDDDFPKKVSEFFPSIPTPLDAAIVFPRDDNIYFMKGSYYWKFDHTKTPPVSRNYPRLISEWKGIPRSIDAAIRIVEQDGTHGVYLFKESKYWKFNDRSESVYLTDPPYPRRTRRLFVGCDSYL